jgi:hypothetical protein
MRTLLHTLAVAALLGASVSAHAWWGPGFGLGDLMGDQFRDFDFSMSGRGSGTGQGYGYGYPAYGYGYPGYGYGYPAYGYPGYGYPGYYGAPTAPYAAPGYPQMPQTAPPQ